MIWSLVAGFWSLDSGTGRHGGRPYSKDRALLDVIIVLVLVLDPFLLILQCAVFDFEYEHEDDDEDEIRRAGFASTELVAGCTRRGVPKVI